MLCGVERCPSRAGRPVVQTAPCSASAPRYVRHKVQQALLLQAAAVWRPCSGPFHLFPYLSVVIAPKNCRSCLPEARSL